MGRGPPGLAPAEPDPKNPDRLTVWCSDCQSTEDLEATPLDDPGGRALTDSVP